MTRFSQIFLWLPLLMGVLVLSACGIGAPGSQLSRDQVNAEARGAFDDYVADLNRGDYAKASLIYDLAPDFHWIERGGIQYESGAEAAVSLLSLGGQGSTPRMTTDEMRITYLSPTSTLISTHFYFQMVDEDGNVQFGFDGWMSVAMVKKENGWVFAAGQVGPGADAKR